MRGYMRPQQGRRAQDVIIQKQNYLANGRLKRGVDRGGLAAVWLLKYAHTATGLKAPQILCRAIG